MKNSVFQAGNVASGPLVMHKIKKIMYKDSNSHSLKCHTKVK